MKLNLRHSWLFIILLIALTLPPATAQAEPLAVRAPQSASVPRFEKGPCAAKLPAGLQEGVDVDCGTLIVPEQYANPDGLTISLAVVIIRAASPNPRPDPLVFAQGGPGGSTIDTYLQMLPSSRVHRNRDMILFDQRGTLYSEPNLLCQELYDETIATLNLDLEPAESEQRYYEASMACRARLVKEGVNLAAFNSVENANDIESLRTALGYKQINLYGISYGTLLALHTMRQHPEGLRSVILDAVVPPTVNFNFESPRTQDRAFTELFKACEEDPSCRREYPDLENFFFDLVDRLNEKPVTIRLKEEETGKTYPALINGDALAGIVFQLLYAHEFVPLLPKMIHTAANGQYAFLETVLPLLVFDKTMSYGMYYSVVCSQGGMDPSGVNYDDIRPELARDAEISNQAMVKLCTDWQVPQLPESETEAVVSDVPTLVFNGRFDPITPPSYGQEVADTLSQDFYFVFPNAGHGALLSSDCADSIFLEFLSNPNKAPDGSCVETIPPVKFLTSADVVDVPAAFTVLMALNDLLGEGKFPAAEMLFLFWVLLLVSSALVFPFMWLVRLARGKPARVIPQVIYLSSWLPVMNGGVLLAFALGFVGVLFQTAVEGGSSYFFGIPAQNQSLLLLPWISGGLTLLTLVFAGAGWVGKYWSVLRKLYYTLLALVSLAALVMLGMSGILTALLG